MYPAGLFSVGNGLTRLRHLRSPQLAGLLSLTAVLSLASPAARAISASEVTPAAAPVSGAIPAPAAEAVPLPVPAVRVALFPRPSLTVPKVFAITPERRALLNTIRFAEGTWADGQELGYRIMFGGGLMESLERHPDRVIRSARYASAAAGAYQFMPFTWSMVSQALGLPGFGPDAQDQAALFLIQRRGGLALADQGELTPQLAARLAPEWASFPTLSGRSYYGQPVKRYEHLRRFYIENLAQLRAQESGTQESGTVATAPEPVTPSPIP